METVFSNHALMKGLLVIVGIVGMAMCTAGIGKVAAAGRWGDPLSIVAYVLGALALGIIVAAVAGWKLPLLYTEWQAILAVLLIIVVKFGLTALHALR